MTNDADSQDHRAALDWITIWESECAALAADREMREGFAAAVALWATRAREAAAWLDAARSAADAPARGVSGPGTQAGPAAAAAAPDARDATIDALAGRVADLERRLAGRTRADP